MHQIEVCKQQILNAWQQIIKASSIFPSPGAKRKSRIEFIYIFIYIYASTAVLFARACEGWVLGKRLRKAIIKVQKAARQKPNQTKATKIETESSLQRAERLEVLSKPKQQKVRRGQVCNE